MDWPLTMTLNVLARNKLPGIALIKWPDQYVDGFLRCLESDTHKTDGTAGNTEVSISRDETIS